MNNSASKKVSFSQISIRSFDLCIGDSPAVLTGVPISLDWTFIESPSLSIEEFEGTRSHVRRSKQELKMSAVERRRRLIEGFGFPEKALNQRAVFPRNPHRILNNANSTNVFPTRGSAWHTVYHQNERKFDGFQNQEKSLLESSSTKLPPMLSTVPPRMCSIPKAA
jgi:hypothetical protein